MSQSYHTNTKRIHIRGRLYNNQVSLILNDQSALKLLKRLYPNENTERKW